MWIKFKLKISTLFFLYALFNFGFSQAGYPPQAVAEPSIFGLLIMLLIMIGIIFLLTKIVEHFLLAKKLAQKKDENDKTDEKHIPGGGGMSLLGNIIWILFGGSTIFIHYIISGLLLFLTIIGLPFGIQVFKMAQLSLWPFGKNIIYKKGSTGCISTLMNIIWFLIGGIWLALHHFLWAIIFAITIIGLPLAKQHIKLAGLAISPFGKEVQ